MALTSFGADMAAINKAIADAESATNRVLLIDQLTHPNNNSVRSE